TLLLLIFASVIEIHSVLFFLETSNRNYHQLQKIDKTKNEFSTAYTLLANVLILRNTTSFGHNIVYAGDVG
ncbi:MAG: hypothetical protein KAW56_04010, partial [Candidatus Marinimicrobia bacterium]|nr:hypothetical protein [Candidatus Neomarinimicrobiota bacterium]